MDRERWQTSVVIWVQNAIHYLEEIGKPGRHLEKLDDIHQTGGEPIAWCEEHARECIRRANETAEARCRVPESSVRGDWEETLRELGLSQRIGFSIDR